MMMELNIHQLFSLLRKEGELGNNLSLLFIWRFLGFFLVYLFVFCQKLGNFISRSSTSTCSLMALSSFH